MFDLGKAVESLAKWEKLRGLIAAAKTPSVDGFTALESHTLDTNPGNLRMWTYVPSEMADDRALVVVLHGCGQTAAGYNHGAGWSTLARRYGFALLLPEQQRSNNPNGCFNWFEPEDTRRGGGEAASIQAMVEKMVRENGIDPRRVFITGLSAGGAMTSVMLACLPRVVRRRRDHRRPALRRCRQRAAGVPEHVSKSVTPGARVGRSDPARRAASQGPWPRVSVWHGNADKTVIPPNAREILKQWTDVHGVSLTPSVETVVDGYPREVWLDRAGEELIESYSITHMAHGTPLATGDAEFECGASGPFLLEVGISSSFHIAKFFGLTRAGVRATSSIGRTRRCPHHGCPPPFRRKPSPRFCMVKY